ncbi:MAG: hypothetical protein J4F42_00700 [Desulfurellaceae bacterium]|nr:hypothetical protein [Desulfurellaceae bacterium]
MTSSTDDSFTGLQTDTYPFERIVLPDDRERFIHIPHSSRQPMLEESPTARSSLSELGISVSTGPVVDFRRAARRRKKIFPESPLGKAPEFVSATLRLDSFGHRQALSL